MRKEIQRAFIYAVALCVLISGNGIVLSIHTCFSKSVKDVSLFNNNSCCNSKKNECGSERHDENPSLNSKCCSLEITYNKINTSFLPQKSFEIPPLTFFSTPVFISCFSTTVDVPVDHFIPPLPSNSLPVAFHQLLI